MDALKTRSGCVFTPYGLWNVLTTHTVHDSAIETTVTLDPLVQAACELENNHFMEGADDAEGVELSSRPPSPLPDLYSHSEGEETTPSTLGSGTAAMKRKRAGAKKRRKRKRIEKARSGHAPELYAAKPSVVKKYVEETSSIKLDIDAQALPFSSQGAWVGKRKKGEKDTPWTLEELLALGFIIIEWDGRKTRFVIDSKKRIVAILVGQPNDPNWKLVTGDATNLMEEARRLGMEADAFGDKYISHRRGDFIALPVGVSFGGGGTKPGNLVHSTERRRLIQTLLDSPSIQRIAGFQPSAFAAFAPKLYQYYARTLGKLFEKHEGLVHNFANSVYPAASFNCGPTTIALDHTDYGNLSHGLCALTALGNYDPTRGGHIVMFNFKLIVQFPPGSTALIPSGCLDHGNTPVQEGETRLSIAQYAAGGLFQWVAYGFKSAKSLLKTKLGKKQKENFDMKDGVRWAEGMDMFSKVDELQMDVATVFGNRLSNTA